MTIRDRKIITMLTNSEIRMWKVRAEATIRSLWSERHRCSNAKERIHYWIRVLRPLKDWEKSL